MPGCSLNRDRFVKLIAEAESKSGLKFTSIAAGGWSAGCAAIREILKSPAAYDRIGRILCIDGIHTGYLNGKPGPAESAIETGNLETWEKLGRDAMAGLEEARRHHSFGDFSRNLREHHGNGGLLHATVGPETSIGDKMGADEDSDLE